MIILSSVLTLLFPILSTIVNFLGFIMSKKHKKIYGMLTALSLATIAYTWKPASNYDLYRWHLEMKYLSHYNFQNFIKFATSNIEILNYGMKYYLALLGDKNLLQFFVTWIGYSEIFWMIADYSKDKEYPKIQFTIMVFFILISLGYIDFISGLWFNLAIINFSLGMYLYSYKKNKMIPYLFMIISALFHVSTIYLLVLFLFLKLTKNRHLIRKSVILFLIFLLVGPILNFLSNTFNVGIFNTFNKLYNSYFIHGDRFESLHGGSNLALALFRLFICVMMILMYCKNEQVKTSNYNLAVFVVFSVVPLIAQAGIFIRFIFFIELLLIPIFLDFVKEKEMKNTKFIIFFIILIIIGLLFVKQYSALKRSNISTGINNNILHNVFNLENK